MTDAALWWLAAVGVLAVADWAAVGLRATPPGSPRSPEYVFKPLTIVALIGVALTLQPVDGVQRTWFVVALVACLAGDVFLMLPGDRFVAGVASFLVGHLAYIGGFWMRGVEPLAFLLAVGVLAVVAVPLLGRVLGGVRRGPDPSLTAPVAVYAGVISLMVATAAASGAPLGLGGAALFYVSDLLIAWNRFVRALHWAPVAIMVTYHLGQAGLVLSLAR